MDPSVTVEASSSRFLHKYPGRTVDVVHQRVLDSPSFARSQEKCSEGVIAGPLAGAGRVRAAAAMLWQFLKIATLRIQGWRGARTDFFAMLPAARSGIGTSSKSIRAEAHPCVSSVHCPCVAGGVPPAK
eukprot:110749-Amphidinium_carterae.1